MRKDEKIERIFKDERRGIKTGGIQLEENQKRGVGLTGRSSSSDRWETSKKTSK